MNRKQKTENKPGTPILQAADWEREEVVDLPQSHISNHRH